MRYVLIGEHGTGDALVTAIGIQASSRQHLRVRLLSTIERVTTQGPGKQPGKPGQLATRLIHADRVVLHDADSTPVHTRRDNLIHTPTRRIGMACHELSLTFSG